MREYKIDKNLARHVALTKPYSHTRQHARSTLAPPWLHWDYTTINHPGYRMKLRHSAFTSVQVLFQRFHPSLHTIRAQPTFFAAAGSVFEASSPSVQ